MDYSSPTPFFLFFTGLYHWASPSHFWSEIIAWFLPWPSFIIFFNRPKIKVNSVILLLLNLFLWWKKHPILEALFFTVNDESRASRRIFGLRAMAHNRFKWGADRNSFFFYFFYEFGSFLLASALLPSRNRRGSFLLHYLYKILGLYS